MTTQHFPNDICVYDANAPCSVCFPESHAARLVLNEIRNILDHPYQYSAVTPSQALERIETTLLDYNRRMRKRVRNATQNVLARRKAQAAPEEPR
jgi:hypothetical protein